MSALPRSVGSAGASGGAGRNGAAPAVPIQASEEVVRAAGPGDLVAYVPHALGFHPRDSVVLVSVRAPRGRLGLVARVDLADLAGAHGSAITSRLARQLRQDGADRVLAVVYRDAVHPDHARGDTAVARAVSTLRGTGAMSRLAEVWLVAASWYACYRCERTGCCPAQGRSVSEIEGSAIAAAFVLRGSAPAEARAALAVGVEPDSAARAAFARAGRRERRSIAAGEGSAAARRAACLEVLLGRRPATAARLGAMAARLGDRTVRDTAMAVLLTGDTSTSWGSLGPGELEEALVRAFAEPPVMPEPHLHTPARAVLRSAARHATGTVRAELLALLGWIHWWCGDGPSADVCIAEARALDPAHRLAGLVDVALAQGVPPGWVPRGPRGGALVPMSGADRGTSLGA